MTTKKFSTACKNIIQKSSRQLRHRVKASCCQLLRLKRIAITRTEHTRKGYDRNIDMLFYTHQIDRKTKPENFSTVHIVHTSPHIVNTSQAIDRCESPVSNLFPGSLFSASLSRWNQHVLYPELTMIVNY